MPPLLDPEGREGLSEAERLTLGWEVRSVCLFIAGAAVLAIDLLRSGRVTWSVYPLLSLGLLFVFSTALRVFHGRPAAIVATMTPALPLFFVGLDWAGRQVPTWSLTIALPISLVVQAAALALVWASMTVKSRGTNLLGFALFAVAGVCLCIETSLRLAQDRPLGFTWSAIVAFSILPVGLFLLYFHYRLARKASLRRIFHL